MTWIYDLLGIKDIYVDSTLVSPRRSAINLIPGANTQIVGVDDADGGRTNVTITSTAGGAGGNASDYKESVRVATTAALPAYTRTGDVITANANGALPTVDSVSLTVGTRRIMFWHGASGSDNGTYDVTQLGDGGTPFILTRTVDGDGNTETFTDGARVSIGEGTLYGGRTFKLTTNDPITLNVTSLVFALDTGLADGTATGQVPRWDGTTWTAGALNLADTDAVTGVLAAANGGVPVPANPADDAKVLTASAGTYTWTAAPTGLPALGAANTVLRVNAGATAVEYAKLTAANLDAAAGIVGTQLSASAAIAASQLADGGAGTVLAGGTPNAFTATPTVTSVTHGASAAAGFLVAATAATWGKSVAAPGLTQTAKDDDTAPQNLTLTPQAPYASATGANRTAGSLVVNLAVPTNSGTDEGSLAVKRSGVFVARLGVIPGATSYSALYFGNAAQTATSYTLAYDGSTSLLVSTPGAQTVFGIVGSWNLVLTSGNFRWATGVTTPLFGQEAKTSDAATQNLTIRAQSAYASASTNKGGGHLLLQGGAEKGAAAGKKGGVRLQLNGTTETIVEATEVAIGQRVVALCRGSDVTTTQMPAGTGDGVVYLANAATAPTTNPASGGVLYSSGGNLFWMSSGGVSTQLTP